ncbi:hypothetical protein AURDEDRAFT_128966 [Auricularia subglabra TFB-10046 SS5]|nr:hypothetical protein AURDEDRAFT_128966 [Auricularia subglabra TFB-10046 SS5]
MGFTSTWCRPGFPELNSTSRYRTPRWTTPFGSGNVTADSTGSNNLPQTSVSRPLGSTCGVIPRHEMDYSDAKLLLRTFDVAEMNGEWRYICPVTGCPESYVRRESVVDHLTKKYPCTNCGRLVTRGDRASTMGAHRKRPLCQKPRPSIPQEECDELVQYRWTLDGATGFACPVVGCRQRVSDIRSHLQAHVRAAADDSADTVSTDAAHGGLDRPSTSRDSIRPTTPICAVEPDVAPSRRAPELLVSAHEMRYEAVGQPYCQLVPEVDGRFASPVRDCAHPVSSALNIVEEERECEFENKPDTESEEEPDYESEELDCDADDDNPKYKSEEECTRSELGKAIAPQYLTRTRDTAAVVGSRQRLGAYDRIHRFDAPPNFSDGARPWTHAAGSSLPAPTPVAQVVITPPSATSDHVGDAHAPRSKQLQNPTSMPTKRAQPDASKVLITKAEYDTLAAVVPVGSSVCPASRCTAWRRTRVDVLRHLKTHIAPAERNEPKCPLCSKSLFPHWKMEDPRRELPNAVPRTGKLELSPDFVNALEVPTPSVSPMYEDEWDDALDRSYAFRTDTATAWYRRATIIESAPNVAMERLLERYGIYTLHVGDGDSDTSGGNSVLETTAPVTEAAAVILPAHEMDHNAASQLSIEKVTVDGEERWLCPVAGCKSETFYRRGAVLVHLERRRVPCTACGKPIAGGNAAWKMEQHRRLKCQPLVYPAVDLPTRKAEETWTSPPAPEDLRGVLVPHRWTRDGFVCPAVGCAEQAAEIERFIDAHSVKRPGPPSTTAADKACGRRPSESPPGRPMTRARARNARSGTSVDGGAGEHGPAHELDDGLEHDPEGGDGDEEGLDDVYLTDSGSSDQDANYAYRPRKRKGRRAEGKLITRAELDALLREHRVPRMSPLDRIDCPVPLCSIRPTQEQLERHLETHVVPAERKMHDCAECGRNYTRMDALQRHMRTAHGWTKSETG